MNTAYSGPVARRGFSMVRMTIVVAIVALTSACASQSGLSGQSSDYLQARQDPAMPACPVESVRMCEVVGGNKFRKRYGRCICASR